MKAQELRIGNLVKQGEIVDLNREHDGESIIRIVNEDMCPFYISINKLKPIPLTKEWLLKFRFKKSVEDFYYIKTGRKNMTLEICLSEQRTILFNKRLNEYIELKNIEYVHQLQNLYFALTGKEIGI